MTNSSVIQSLKGSWIMERALSTETDPIFKVQGIGFLVRKALVLAPVRLQISAYEQCDSPTSNSVLKIDCSQTIPGGLAGTTEKRTVDWTWQSHSDYIFGSVKHRSQVVGGTLRRDGQEQPDFELQTELKGSRVKEFLLGDILPDGSSSDGFAAEPPNGDPSNQNGWWVHVFASNENSGWTAEQIWGFEIIDGKRYHTRRIVVANRAGKFVLARLVFSQSNKE